MEVHHHAHHDHGKKTWKSYFWEFFMLFLAVFCGSLAELQIEHYIEHQREKKYAQTLVADLTNDTLDLHHDITHWEETTRKADTILAELEKPFAARNHPLLYKCVAEINTNNTFLYHDRTVQQLKSAGNFRLIRNNAVADSLVEYDTWIRTTVNNIESAYGKELSSALLLLENQLFNKKFFRAARNNGSVDSLFQLYPAAITMQKGKEDIVFQFYNKVCDHKSLTRTRIYHLGTTLRRARNLITLKQNYPVE